MAIRMRCCVGALALLGVSVVTSSSTYNDFHYPTEEQAEHTLAFANLPHIVSVSDGNVDVECVGGMNKTVLPAGDAANGITIGCGSILWTAEAVLPHKVALSHAFPRWGLIIFIGMMGEPVIDLRKPVGMLERIDQPWFNISDSTFDKIDASNDDIPMNAANKTTKFLEPDYPSTAAQLAPQRDTAAISHAADVVKFAVAYSGRIKCASTGVLAEDTNTGGIAELQDLHAQPPDSQKIIFDPSDYLSFWPRTYDNMKSGLIGRHLGVANVGAYTTASGGFELVAFGPLPPNQPGGVPAPPSPPVPPLPPLSPWQCHHFTAQDMENVTKCELTGKSSMQCQELVCQQNTHQRWSGGQNTNYSGCGTCFCCENASAVVPLPRLPNINYDPGVFVMLREVRASPSSKTNGTRFFYAKNSTTFELEKNGATTFYSALLAVQNATATLLDPAMKIELPASDQRQADMVNAALLATSNNYVGNQPNYGFGATYWSYGREDNGSLPLDMLSVDSALLEWGVCDLALDHIEFYLQNYINSDGTVWYGVAPWTTQGDSISDYGRLVDIYIKAVRLCSPSDDWKKKQLVPVMRIGELLLRLQQAAPKPDPIPPGPLPRCIFGQEIPDTYIEGNGDCGTDDFSNLESAQAACIACNDCGGVTQQYGEFQLREGNIALNGSNGHPSNSWVVVNSKECRPTSIQPGTAGLIIGAPEHDWSSTKDKYFYNNNAWSAAGLERLGLYLSRGSNPINTTMGLVLYGAGVSLRKSILASAVLCNITDPSTGRVIFLPPYAQVNTTVYPSMHATAEASYANFRFFSEPMLAAVMPPEVEEAWLTLHNNHGGRVGGASRWETHLDDMPTAGWGFGALRNNRTQDFLALLYGHMASYQSRGTFHSTEQLSYRGSGRYRGFLHIDDPSPLFHSAPTKASRHRRYFGTENDISFCIVSNILVARLTRWQLVLEEAQQIASSNPFVIWIAKGAPRRWFVAPSTGFNVTNAPTSVGLVNYALEVIGSTASYSVVLSKAPTGLQVVFSLRFPGHLAQTSVSCKSCTVRSQDDSLGIVTVSPSSAAFTVSAQWS